MQVTRNVLTSGIFAALSLYISVSCRQRNLNNVRIFRDDEVIPINRTMLIESDLKNKRQIVERHVRINYDISEI